MVPLSYPTMSSTYEVVDSAYEIRFIKICRPRARLALGLELKQASDKLNTQLLLYLLRVFLTVSLLGAKDLGRTNRSNNDHSS